MVTLTEEGLDILDITDLCDCAIAMLQCGSTSYEVIKVIGLIKKKAIEIGGD